MTPVSPVIAELRGLLDALCEESITPDQLQRLEQLVLTHPEAEAYYVQFMSFYSDLVRNVAGLPGRAERSVRERAGEAQPVRAAEVGTEACARTSRRWLLGLGAIGLVGLAAGVLVVVSLWPRPLLLDPRRPQDVAAAEAIDDTVAVLLHTNRAVWEETGLPTRPGTLLPPGRLVLKSGFAQIECYSGAKAILEGPVEFRLGSRMEAYCARGKLRATVPQHAQGFRIGSPAVNLVDRGTEFGLDVGEKTAVHVFKGEVDLYEPGSAPAAAPRKKLLTKEAVSLDAPGVLKTIPSQSGEFLTASELADRVAKDTLVRQRHWTTASETLRKDPSLVVYYTFQGIDPLSRALLDVSRGREEHHDGAVVGGEWGNGRWRGRQGLEFKRMSDRVRLHVPGEFQSLTMAAWVRPDALPNVNNSLLMADGWEEGEFHWQIGSDGTLILGIKGPPNYNPEPNVRGPQYRAHGVITPERFGRWVHLAVTYDRERGEVVHYVDGKLAAQIEILLDIPCGSGTPRSGAGMRLLPEIRVGAELQRGHGRVPLIQAAAQRLGDRRTYTQGRPPL